DQGGDLGYFGRGAMLPPVEQAAFALSAGQTSGIVKSEVGYHLIQVVTHLMVYAEPLSRVYTNVGTDAANEKSKRISQARAESLYQAVKTPAGAAAAAAKARLRFEHYEHRIGDYSMFPEKQLPMIRRLESLKPGKLYPGVEFLAGNGHF